MAPNVVANVSSDHSTSNGVGIVPGDALESELWPFQVQKLCFIFKPFQAPIIVSIARSRFSTSNGVGIMSGDALEPKL